MYHFVVPGAGITMGSPRSGYYAGDGQRNENNMAIDFGCAVLACRRSCSIVS